MKHRILLSLPIVIVFLVLALPVHSLPATTSTVTLSPLADEVSNVYGVSLGVETPLAARGSAEPGGACVSQFESFLKFDLAAVPSSHAITSALLTLHSTDSVGTSLTMNLYGSSDDTWIEGITEIPWATRPRDTNDLLAASPLIAGATDIIFSSTPQFLDFLNEQNRGDDRATLAIKLTACSHPYAGQYIAPRESPAGPVLTLQTEPPNAVMLGSSAASASWPLYVTLAVLALVIAAGLAISRRRSDPA